MNELKFEVGDRVWSFSKQEWGEVAPIDFVSDQYPVRVQFDSGEDRWVREDDLFFERIVIPASARTRPTQVNALTACVDRFARTMKAKLVKKYYQGYSGWDDPNWKTDEIRQALIDHIEKGDPVDMANYALFLWIREKNNERT